MEEIHLHIKERFYRTDPKLLEGIEDFVVYLESILNDQCSVMEIEGELVLLQIKALVDNVRGMRIEIHPNEHPPPHFHVVSGNLNASFRIDDCSKLDGSIYRHDYDKIRYWHKHAKPKLIEMWNKTRPTDCVVGHYKE